MIAVSALTVKEMLDAGVHFGHQTQKWDPRMQPYIFGARRGIHIIDLDQTVPLFHAACDFVKEVVASGGDVLFVGTKRQAQSIVEEQAKRCGMHYVHNRWLGGTLTNFRTVKASIDRLKDLESKIADGFFDSLKKRERRQREREVAKLRKVLSGIKEMSGFPALIFIIDPHKEHIAKSEANRLKIPIVALTDTNCNPGGIDHLVPGNDDAIKAIRLLTTAVADACIAGIAERQARIREEIAVSEAQAEKAAKEKSSAKEQGPVVREVQVDSARAFISRAVLAESKESDESDLSASSASPAASEEIVTEKTEKADE
jgi:small subunit ribosomal protein S2